MGPGDKWKYGIGPSIQKAGREKKKKGREENVVKDTKIESFSFFQSLSLTVFHIMFIIYYLMSL